MTSELFVFEQVTVADRDGTLGRPRLDDVSATIPSAGLTAVLGPSGSGKSTLLRLCNRLERPDGGRVLLRGVDLQTMEAPALRRSVAMLFQATTPFPGTVADNLRVAEPGLSDDDAAGLLDLVTLPPDRLDQSADHLSGGELQRLGLARALATRPDVLLADEPTSALDGAARDELERTVTRLVGEGMPIVWVTHDEDQAARLAAAILRIDMGRVSGPEPTP